MELGGEVGGRLPDDVVVLPGVEVELLRRVVPAGRDDHDAEASREPGFVVHARALSREVGDNEPTPPNLGHNTVVDLLVVLDSVDAQRAEVPGTLDAGFKAVLSGIVEARIEPHARPALRSQDHVVGVRSEQALLLRDGDERVHPCRTTGPDEREVVVLVQDDGG